MHKHYSEIWNKRDLKGNLQMRDGKKKRKAQKRRGCVIIRTGRKEKRQKEVLWRGKILWWKMTYASKL